MLGVAHGGSRVARLDTDDDLGVQTSPRVHDRLGTGDSLLELQEGVFAGQLRPDDAVYAGSMQEADLLGKRLQVNGSVVTVRRGDDRENPAELAVAGTPSSRSGEPAE